MSHEQLPQGISSRAVHGGERQQRLGDALTVPIYQTATYVFRDTQELIDFKEGRIDKGEYGRYGNPTVHAAERKLARRLTAQCLHQPRAEGIAPRLTGE